ncbi:DEKNAAC103825 [Brettanomyces naardenensis]|uniref:DEKNAAC103825 n=1 Tax=Brettanomyces naardenensis TaxID=13370 RepID=A0A448YPB4_BRENA|nr:DEKNAAC103825 [Brettanomyces naardenensis]
MSNKEDPPTPEQIADSSSFSSIQAIIARMRKEAGGEPVESSTAKKHTFATPLAKTVKNHTSPQTRNTPTPKQGFQTARQRMVQEETTRSNFNSPDKSREIIFRGQSGQDASYEATRHVNLRKQTFRSIQVKKNQNGNPLLSSLTNVSYEFNGRIHDVDYLINSHCFALFLSVKYHKLHPEYIYHRIKKIGYNPNNKSMVRVLLALVDVENADDAMRELNKLCMFNNMTLVTAWSFEQCADYLTALKQCEMNAGKTLIQGNLRRNDDMSDDGNYYERVVEVLTSVRTVNKTDAVNMISRFGSMRELCQNANEENLQDVPGVGGQKVGRLLKVINEPFVYTSTD